MKTKKSYNKPSAGSVEYVCNTRITVENESVQEMVISGLLNCIELVEIIADGDCPVTATHEIWNEDSLVFKWKISTNTDPKLKKQVQKYLKIEGRKYYSEEDLEVLKTKSII